AGLVGSVRGGVVAEAVEGERERELDVEGGAAAHADPPTRRAKIPRRLDVSRAVPRRRESDHVGAITPAHDVRALGGNGSRLEVAGEDRRLLAGGGDLARAGPAVDRPGRR